MPSSRRGGVFAGVVGESCVCGRRVDAAENGAGVDEEVNDGAPQDDRWEFKGRQVGRGVSHDDARVGGQRSTVRGRSSVVNIDAESGVGVSPDDEAPASTGRERGGVVVDELVGPFAHDGIGASCFERAPEGR